MPPEIVFISAHVLTVYVQVSLCRVKFVSHLQALFQEKGNRVAIGQQWLSGAHHASPCSKWCKGKWNKWQVTRKGTCHKIPCCFTCASQQLHLLQQERTNGQAAVQLAGSPLGWRTEPTNILKRSSEPKICWVRAQNWVAAVSVVKSITTYAKRTAFQPKTKAFFKWSWGSAMASDWAPSSLANPAWAAQSRPQPCSWCMFVFCEPVFLSVCLSVFLSVCLSVWKQWLFRHNRLDSHTALYTIHENIPVPLVTNSRPNRRDCTDTLLPNVTGSSTTLI